MEDQSFLGRGWSFPVAFMHKGGGVLMSSDKDNIDHSLDILLSTEVSERLLQYNFGCRLQQFVYEEFNASLVSRIKDAISTAILMYESRINLLSIAINRDLTNFSKIIINMEYSIRTTNTRSNKVYPFYLTEANN